MNVNSNIEEGKESNTDKIAGEITTTLQNQEDEENSRLLGDDEQSKKFFEHSDNEDANSQDSELNDTKFEAEKLYIQD